MLILMPMVAVSSLHQPVAPLGGRRVGEAFRELATLGDGRKVWLRMVRPDDKTRLVEGFARLSEHSRRSRFLLARGALSDNELAYLTEVDGERHLAIVAARAVGLAEGEGLGVARFIVLPDAPDVAEIAVTVVDEAQGMGLGRLLVRRLVQAARERGVRVLRAVMLPHNRAMRSLMKRIDPRAVERWNGFELQIDASL